MTTYRILVLSAFFGLCSIISDQVAYQVEKYMIDVELKISENRSFWLDSITLNEIYSGMDEQIRYFSQYFHDEYNYGKDRKDYEIRIEDIENLAFLKSNISIELEAMNFIAGEQDLSISLEGMRHFSASPPTRENFYSELKQLDFFSDIEITNALNFSADNANLLNKEASELLDEKSRLNFYRQIALLISISMSLVSLLCLFIFFRVTMAQNTKKSRDVT